MTDSFSGATSAASNRPCPADAEADGCDPEATELDHFLAHIDDLDREQRYGERFGFASDDQMDPGGFDDPLVFELGNIRSLLASWAYVQSAMSIDDPDRLMLDYTQTMMGFLLFNDTPGTIEIIGLGGGSLAKYCHRFLKAASVRGIEIDPEVIAVGELFCIPPESRRFEIICEDGAEFVRNDPHRCDVILVDGFDKDGQSAQLCSADFYRNCWSRLNAGGVFVANLCDYPWRNDAILNRLQDCFGRSIVVPVEGEMNRIVFALKGPWPPHDGQAIMRRARALDLSHPMRFTAR